MRVPEKVLKFAKEKGYDGAEYLKKWKGHSAYEPIFGNGEEPCCVGLPLVILDNGKEIRMSTAEECFEI